MGLESALWEATRPAFRVRYIHDPTSAPRVPLYASYGVATGPTARAKLARIVRKAPEVVATSKPIWSMSGVRVRWRSKPATVKS
jgi:hypothetical protein